MRLSLVETFGTIYSSASLQKIVWATFPRARTPSRYGERVQNALVKRACSRKWFHFGQRYGTHHTQPARRIPWRRVASLHLTSPHPALHRIASPFSCSPDEKIKFVLYDSFFLFSRFSERRLIVDLRNTDARLIIPHTRRTGRLARTFKGLPDPRRTRVGE